MNKSRYTDEQTAGTKHLIRLWKPVDGGQTV